jgi:hypothetical protein
MLHGRAPHASASVSVAVTGIMSMIVAMAILMVI